MASRTMQRPGTPLTLSIRLAAGHEEAIESFVAVTSALVPIQMPPEQDLTSSEHVECVKEVA